MWPFGKEPPARGLEISEHTRRVRDRTERLAEMIDAQGVETKAVAREAEQIRQANHFGPALQAAFSTPRSRRP